MVRIILDLVKKIEKGDKDKSSMSDTLILAKASIKDLTTSKAEI